VCPLDLAFFRNFLPFPWAHSFFIVVHRSRKQTKIVFKRTNSTLHSPWLDSTTTRTTKENLGKGSSEEGKSGFDRQQVDKPKSNSQRARFCFFIENTNEQSSSVGLYYCSLFLSLSRPPVTPSMVILFLSSGYQIHIPRSRSRNNTTTTQPSLRTFFSCRCRQRPERVCHLVTKIVYQKNEQHLSQSSGKRQYSFVKERKYCVRFGSVRFGSILSNSFRGNI